MAYYSAVQASSLKQYYSENDIVDFIIKMKPNKAILPGSIRLSGDLNVTTNRTTNEAIVLEDMVHLDQFAGVHSFFRSINTQVNNSTIENVQQYPRIVSMMTQANNTLESLVTESSNLCELKGLTNNFQLVGNSYVGDAKTISFSMLPQISLNMASDMLSQQSFQNIQLSMVLSNSVEALYTNLKTDDPRMKKDLTKFSALQYKLFNLLLSWTEVDMITTKAQPVVMPVKHVYNQTVTSQTSYLNITTPMLYNAMSISFMKQSERNSIFHNNLKCSKIFGLDDVGGSLELLINGTDTIIPYQIEDYQDVAVNYLKSLNGNVNKNVIMNKFMETQSFGIGFQMLTSSNDRLAINLKINGSAYNNVIPKYDAFIYINSFIEI